MKGHERKRQIKMKQKSESPMRGGGQEDKQENKTNTKNFKSNKLSINKIKKLRYYYEFIRYFIFKKLKRLRNNY